MTNASGDGGPGKGFYLLLGVLAAGGIAALLLAGGGGGEELGPLTLRETSVEADSGAAAAVGGREDAPVTLVEFADYQCPACAQFAAFTGRLLRQNYVREGVLRWVFHDFPLEQHPNAVPAALAARCAGVQGRYWEMHDLLFANQADWAGDSSPRDKFDEYGERIGLDGDRFGSCYSERRFVEEIVASRKYGIQLGVASTPTVFIDGRQVRGGYETMERAIQEALERRGAGEGASASSGGAEGDGETGGRSP